MKCIICHKDSGKSDCCKKCQNLYTEEQIDAVRQSKAEAEAAKAEFEATLKAENTATERQRQQTRSLWNDLLRRGF